MIFTATIDTPYNTPKTTALVTSIVLSRGLIYRFEVDFPPGSAGLLHLYTTYQGTRLYPRDAEDDFYGNDRMISFEDLFFLDVEPFEIIVYTYNDDAVFDHSCQIRIGLADTDEAIRSYMPSFTNQEIVGLYEKMLGLQERVAGLLNPDPLRFLEKSDEKEQNDES